MIPLMRPDRPNSSRSAMPMPFSPLPISDFSFGLNWPLYNNLLRAMHKSETRDHASIGIVGLKSSASQALIDNMGKIHLTRQKEENRSSDCMSRYLAKNSINPRPSKYDEISTMAFPKRSKTRLNSATCVGRVCSRILVCLEDYCRSKQLVSHVLFPRE
jgi:hypothetical protein